MYSRGGRRYISGNSERYLRQENPLLAYFNYLWEVPDNKLYEVLQKNTEKFQFFLRVVLSPDEIINTVYLLLRISKLDEASKIKATTITVFLTEVSQQLSTFIIYIPFLRNSEYQENLERFWFAILELIQELIKLNDPQHKEHVQKIYLNCKMVTSYKKNIEKLKLSKIPESIINDLKIYLDLDDIEPFEFYLSQSEIEKFNLEEAVTLKNFKEFKSYKEYFKWQYAEIKREYISSLSKAVKQLQKDFNSDSDKIQFHIFLNCTGKLNSFGYLMVTTGECRQKEYENARPQGLVCFSYNSYKTYTFGILLRVFPKSNAMIVRLINIDPCLLSKTFSMSIYRADFYGQKESIFQSIKKKVFQDLPFEEYIVSGRYDCIKRPKYLQDESEYIIDDCKFKPCDFNTWPQNEFFQLDAEQYLAFQHLITNELAVLTGYPGSGKTHVVLKFINLLLNNKQVWQRDNTGPILILAFTNTLLDNFLEKILPLTDSIVRIGKGITSEKFNILKEDASDVSRCIETKITVIADEIKNTVKEAQAVYNNGGLIKLEYLGISTISDRRFYDKLIRISETERIELMNEVLDVEENNTLTDVNPARSHIYYVTVSDLQNRHDDNSPYLYWRLAHKEAHKRFYSQNDANNDNIQNLSGNKLWGFYFYLVDKYINKLKEKLDILEKQRETLNENLNEEQNKHSSEKIKNKMIVGFTFSGAALRKSMVDALNSPIVIVEQSSDVELYYILGTIPKSCKHLILIGDSRPAIKASEINNSYSLIDILSKHKYPATPLKKQLRMKSDIALLLKTLFYPDMTDAENVGIISNVPCIPKPIFFINHFLKDDIKENINCNSTVNLYEIKYLVHLVKFLLSKNVSAESITILTTTYYECLELNKLQENDEALQKVKSSSIDDIQTLENDIILLSLFGINEYDRTFLTKENRLRVVFSRSKRGLYLIGNMETLCKEYNIWVSIREFLEEKGYIGDSLPISCPLHVGKECVFVEKPEDFLKEDLFVGCSHENVTINE